MIIWRRIKWLYCAIRNKGCDNRHEYLFETMVDGTHQIHRWCSTYCDLTRYHSGPHRDTKGHVWTNEDLPNKNPHREER